MHPTLCHGSPPGSPIPGILQAAPASEKGPKEQVSHRCPVTPIQWGRTSAPLGTRGRWVLGFCFASPCASPLGVSLRHHAPVMQHDELGSGMGSSSTRRCLATAQLEEAARCEARSARGSWLSSRPLKLPTRNVLKNKNWFRSIEHRSLPETCGNSVCVCVCVCVYGVGC